MEGDGKNITRERRPYFPKDECRVVGYVVDVPSFSNRSLAIPVKIESVEFSPETDVQNKTEREQNALQIKILSYHGVYPPPIFRGDKIRAYIHVYALQKIYPLRDTVAIELLDERGELKAEYRLAGGENTRYSTPLTSTERLVIRPARREM